MGKEIILKLAEFPVFGRFTVYSFELFESEPQK